MELSYNGLSDLEARRQLEAYGRNTLGKQKANILRRFLAWFISPITLMLIFAAVFSFALGKTFDFFFILLLVCLNFSIQAWQEYKADNSIKELQKNLVVEAKVFREGEKRFINSELLVPGDIVELVVGDLVPADAKVTESNNFSVNQSSLTGESLPQERNKDEELFSGSFVASGRAIVKVTATGKKTYFGKTLMTVEKDIKRSELEEDIIIISRFLMIVSLVSVAVLTVFFILKRFPLLELVRLDLGLIIAGVPIALPTVMALILFVGAKELARKKVIVRRLSVLENLANASMFLTDKTGTVTQNKIGVHSIIPYNGNSERDVMKYALVASEDIDNSFIDDAIRRKAVMMRVKTKAQIVSFIPADSERKRATSVAKISGRSYVVSMGAPQVIEKLLRGSSAGKRFARDLKEAANKGLRMLAVAVKIGKEEKGMKLAGFIALSDPLVSDAKRAVDFMKKNGITTKMVTGDNNVIAKHIASELKLEGDILTPEKMKRKMNLDDFRKTSVFAEVLPKDKLDILKLSQKKYITAMTGDGVNDIPAVKMADAGIAVRSAVDALKSSADIVLLSYGISVIRDAFIEARKIFARLYAYSVYRISESFRLIFTVLILGLVIQFYPLTPIQLILIAFLNDIPIVSLAFNRVKYAASPQKINARKRFVISIIFGTVGIANSLILFFFLRAFNFPLDVIQTMYFLKLTVSGHLLIYVAHTEERWWRYLPSYKVIAATTITQIIASLIAFFGVFMTPIPAFYVLFIWIWAFFWMQIAELTKILRIKFNKTP